MFLKETDGKPSDCVSLQLVVNRNTRIHCRASEKWTVPLSLMDNIYLLCVPEVFLLLYAFKTDAPEAIRMLSPMLFTYNMPLSSLSKNPLVDVKEPTSG